MRPIRRLLLPAVIGTPLVIWVLPVRSFGWHSLLEFNELRIRFADVVFGFLLTVVGIALIGLPAARFLRTLELPAAVKAALLVVGGSAGGGLVAVLFVLLLALLTALSGEQVDLGDLGNPILAAQYGLLPGAVVAAVWTALNFDSLKSEQHA